MKSYQSRTSTMMLLQILWSQAIFRILNSAWPISPNVISSLGSLVLSSRTTWLRSSKMLMLQEWMKGTTIRTKTSSWQVMIGSKSWLVIPLYQVSNHELIFCKETRKSDLLDEAEEQARPIQERIKKASALSKNLRRTRKIRGRKKSGGKKSLETQSRIIYSLEEQILKDWLRQDYEWAMIIFIKKNFNLNSILFLILLLRIFWSYDHPLSR